MANDPESEVGSQLVCVIPFFQCQLCPVFRSSDVLLHSRSCPPPQVLDCGEQSMIAPASSTVFDAILPNTTLMGLLNSSGTGTEDTKFNASLLRCKIKWPSCPRRALVIMSVGATRGGSPLAAEFWGGHEPRASFSLTCLIILLAFCGKRKGCHERQRCQNHRLALAVCKNAQRQISRGVSWC